MSEEEKEAKYHLEMLAMYGLGDKIQQIDIDKIDIILDLIDKLQKGNQQLKENKHLKDKIEKKIDTLDAWLYKAQKSNNELAKEKIWFAIVTLKELLEET